MLPVGVAHAGATTCSTRIPGIDVQECTSVVGSGLKITSISGRLLVDKTGGTYHIEIFGPHGLIKNCASYKQTTTSFGPWCTFNTADPNVNNVAGDYCSEGWEFEGGTTWRAMATECIGVS